MLRRLHCPWLLLELMLLIYRAIFVLLDIAGAIQTAQNCRLGNRSFSSKLRCMGQMLSVLLVRSLKKSSLLYDAMESRLYDGRIRVLEETAPAPCLAVGSVRAVAGGAVWAVRAMRPGPIRKGEAVCKTS